MVDALSNMEEIMKKVYEIGGLPHFHVVEEEVSPILSVFIRDLNYSHRQSLVNEYY